MADDLKRVGLVFKADGTVDFNKSLKEVNASIKENYSAFKLAKSQWDENTKASEKLRAEQRYLSAEVKDYTDKVKMLQGQLSELSEKESKNTEKIKKKTEQLNAAKNTAEAYRQKCDALKSELEQLERDENANSEAVKKKKNQVEKAEKAYADYSSKAEKLEADIEKLNTGEANNEAAIQKKKAQLENAQATLNNYQKSLDEVNKKLETGTADIQEYGKKLEETGEKISKVGGKISDVGNDLTKKVTVPIAGVTTAAIKVAADFDSAMSQVAAVSGATGDELQALRDKAREMGEKTKFSASEAAEAMNYMAMAGWKTGDMLEGIEGIMNLAAASGEDLASTSDIVTDALTAFGLTAEDSGHFADVLAAASSNANTNVSMMGETFKYCAPIAGSLGFSVEDTAEAIGLMANAGIKSTQAGTSLRTIMTNLSGDVKICGSAIGEVTIATTNADGSMRGLSDILTDCRAAFGGLTESERANAAEALVGKNAMSGFLALMNAGEGDIKKLNSAIDNCNGKTEEMAGIMQDNLTGQMTILKSQLEELAISFGEIMMPVIRDIVSGIQGFVDELNGMDEEQRKTIITIGLVLAAVGPVLGVIGKITDGVGGVINIGGKLVTATAKAGPTITGVLSGIKTVAGALFSFIAANPIVAIITVIIGAIILLWNKCEWFRNGVQQFWEGIISEFSEAGEFIKGIIEDIKGFFENAGENITGLFEGIVEKIKYFFSGKWIPNIPLPHPTITGDFSLVPPRMPKFDIEWYANGGILNRPTAIGMNGNSLMAGGEAGKEAILPISLLKQYIREENQMNNAALADIIMNAMGNMSIIAENNINIGDRQLYKVIVEMVIKELSGTAKNLRAAKGVI